MGVYILTQLGVLFILVRESPFVMLAETPVDGGRASTRCSRTTGW